MKLRIKKTLLKRPVNGVTIPGYYGRVITNGKKDFDSIARESAKNTTLHPREAALAAELLIEGVCSYLKEGYIVDLGPLGTLYPAVNGSWKRDASDLQLSEMTAKVNYKASDDISSAVRAASLAWASSTDTGNESPVDDQQTGNGSGEGDEGGDSATGFILTLTAGEGGTVSASPEMPQGGYPDGTSVTITATPNSDDGYFWNKWSDEDTNQVRTIIMNENKSLQALFRE